MEALDLPLGHIMTIINIRLITKGAKRRKTAEEEEAELWAILARK